MSKDVSYLKQDKVTFTHKKVINICLQDKFVAI